MTRAGHQVTVFPALVDEGETVGLGVFGSADEQEARHRLGVRRLVLLGLGDHGRFDSGGLGTAEKLGLAGSPYPSVARLLDDCRAAAVGVVVDARAPVRSQHEYDASLAEVREDVPDRVPAVVDEVLRVLDAWRQADKLLSGRADMALLPALADMKAQLARLVRPGFVADAGEVQLRRYPTYLAALTKRRADLTTTAAIARDRVSMDQVGALQESWLHQLDALPHGRPPGAHLRQARWMLEEYRVSLWAQQLGTAYPVSDQRIRKALAPKP